MTDVKEYSETTTNEWRGIAESSVGIEVFDTSKISPTSWVQAKYLAHSLDDCLWTNDIHEAFGFLLSSLENLRIAENPEITID